MDDFANRFLVNLNERAAENARREAERRIEREALQIRVPLYWRELCAALEAAIHARRGLEFDPAESGFWIERRGYPGATVSAACNAAGVDLRYRFIDRPGADARESQVFLAFSFDAVSDRVVPKTGAGELLANVASAAAFVLAPLTGTANFWNPA